MAESERGGTELRRAKTQARKRDREGEGVGELPLTTAKLRRWSSSTKRRRIDDAAAAGHELGVRRRKLGFARAKVAAAGLARSRGAGAVLL